MDPAEAEARAHHVKRHAELLSGLEQKHADWWDRLDKANHFRQRWEEVTGRAS
jgi:hypothetical protein